VAKRREVKDGETSVAEPDFEWFWERLAKNDGAMIVRPSVGKRSSSPPE